MVGGDAEKQAVSDAKHDSAITCNQSPELSANYEGVETWKT
jgi:hypothetical protein